MQVFSLSCMQWPHKSTLNISNKFCRSFILKTGSHNCQDQSSSHPPRQSVFFSELAGHIPSPISLSTKEPGKSWAELVDHRRPGTITHCPLDRHRTNQAPPRSLEARKSGRTGLFLGICTSAHFWSCMELMFFFLLRKKRQEFHMMIYLPMYNSMLGKCDRFLDQANPYCRLRVYIKPPTYRGLQEHSLTTSASSSLRCM